MLKKIIATLTTLFVLLVQVESKADTGYKYINGNIIRWHDRNVNVCISRSAAHIGGIVEAAQGAISVWADISTAPKLHFVESEVRCKIFIKMDKIPKQWDFEPLATNTISNYGNGEILYSEVVLNKYYDGLFGDAEKSKRFYDLRSIIYHEIGHALGLEEEYSDRGSIMYLTFFQGSTIKRQLTRTDIRSLVGLYGNFHLREN